MNEHAYTDEPNREPRYENTPTEWLTLVGRRDEEIANLKAQVTQERENHRTHETNQHNATLEWQRKTLEWQTKALDLKSQLENSYCHHAIQTTDLNKQLADRDNTILKWKRQASDLNAQISRYSGLTQSQAAKISQLQNEAAVLQAKVNARLRPDLQELHEEIESLRGKLEEKKEGDECYYTSLENKNEEIRQLNKTVESVRKANEALVGELADMNTQLEKTNNLRDYYKNRLGRIEETFNRRYSEYETAMIRLRDENANARAFWESEVHKTKVRLEEANNWIAGMRDRCSTQADLVGKLEEETGRLKRENDNLHREIMQTNQQNENLHKENAAQTQQIAIMRTKIPKPFEFVTGMKVEARRDKEREEPYWREGVNEMDRPKAGPQLGTDWTPIETAAKAIRSRLKQIDQPTPNKLNTTPWNWPGGYNSWGGAWTPIETAEEFKEAVLGGGPSVFPREKGDVGIARNPAIRPEVKPDWRIGMAVTPKMRSHPLFQQMGAVRKVFPAGGDIPERINVEIYNRTGDTTCIQEPSNDWMTA